MTRKRSWEFLMWPEEQRLKGQRPRRQFVSFMFLSVLGLGLCLLCYSSFFPIRGGVVWNTPFGTKTSLLSSLSALWNFHTHISHNDDEERSCHFPKLNPFDPAISEFIKKPPPVDCEAQYPPRFRTNLDNQLIPIEGNYSNETCCYKVVTRDKESDHNILYSKKCYPLSLTDSTDIPPEHEFISIKCSQGPISSSASTTHKDMFAFVHLKPEVEARVEEYERIRSHRGEDHRLNVLIIGLDAQSHMNFIRQMPLTHEFLTQKLGGVGLKGYTKVGDNTFPNVIPLLSGLSVSQLQKSCWPSKSSYFDSCPFIWKHFANSGYRTFFSEDSIWMGTFNYEKKGFLTPPTDYYLHPLTLLMAKKIGHETWGNAKLCYGPRLAFEVLLNHVLKASVTMRGKHSFQYVWANSLFHDYLNHPKLGDKLLLQTLEYLSTNGLLDNTLLMLVSDHGIRWGSIRSTYQGKIEERMPMAYIAFPKWFRQQYKEEMDNLAQNSEVRLTTPFDVHATLLHVLEIGGTGVGVSNNKDFKGSSLLRPIPSWRMCKDAGVEEHWCVCNFMEKVPKNSSTVLVAAQFIVREINRGLSDFTMQCAKLDLHLIKDAMRMVDNSSSHKNNSIKETPEGVMQLQIIIETKPGGGLFEATVHRLGGGVGMTISGEISRLNLYREQSLCVKDYMAQKFCFCLDKLEIKG